MKGFGKRLRVLVSCILLVCLLTTAVSAVSTESCPGSCAHQAALDAVHYDTLAEAIAAANPDSTVTLLTDVTTTAPLTITKSLTLDLGGKSILANLSEPEQAAVCFLEGGTVRGGKIIASTGSALLVSGCTVVIEKDVVLEGSGAAPVLRITAAKDQTARVDLSGVVISKGSAPAIEAASADGSCELYVLKDAQITSLEDIAIVFACSGKLDISDGTIQAKKDAISVTIAKEQKTELAISGGKILSQEGQVIVITAEEGAQVPTDFITGGTYEELPADYIPSYAKIQENADGTVTVISTYILTFHPGSGTGTMDPIKVPFGSTIQLPPCGFTAPADMDFAGWKIGDTLLAPGDDYTPDADVTLKALWKTHEHTGGSANCLNKAICQTCGKAYGKLGPHNLKYNGGYTATCTNSGMNAHSTCNLCGNCFVDGVMISAASLSIPALGHNWENVEGKPATCDEDGFQAYRKCKTCATLQVDGKDASEENLLIPAPGHTMETIAATQATCEEAGIQAHEHCTTCDQLFLQGAPVEAAALTTATSSHVLSDWISDAYYHWKACVDCGEVYRQKDHADNDQNGACDDCGYEMAPEKDDTIVEESSFSWIFLIPVIAAVAIAIPLAIKKRKA